MCIAIPVKIEEIYPDKGTAKASLSGNLLDVNIRLVSAKVGDYVLVHAGCAVEVLKKERALEILSILDELEEPEHDA